MVSNAVLSLLTMTEHQPLLQMLAIILGTFILEDAATVFAAMETADGVIPLPLALVSLYIGIVLGDLGLYGLGVLASKVAWIARLLPPRRAAVMRAWLNGRVFKVVLVSRFLPGMRLPTYTTCGFVRANLLRFALAAVLATLLWTSTLFGISIRIGQVLIDHLGAWRWAGAAGFALALIVAGRTAARLQGATR